MKVVATKEFFDSVKKIGSLKNKFYEFRGWWRAHKTKTFWNIIKTAFKGYPWDESYLYYLEKAKLQEMVAYHEKQQRFVGVERVIRDMKLCIKLIDIFRGDETKLFTYTGGLKFKPTENGEGYEVNGDDLKYHCLVKVNTKNMDRFVFNKSQKKIYTMHPHELYMEKAKKLYHKIRYERDGAWWD